MYEYLDHLTDNSGELLAGLRPVSKEKIESITAQYPKCPNEYIQFLSERGVGGMEEGFVFYIENTLIDAETELFFDDDIYQYGAKGPIKIFGSTSNGINYGFDTGLNWQLVKVDSYRIVDHLSLTFKQFIDGLFVCFPDFPVSYDSGKWKVATGEEYSL